MTASIWLFCHFFKLPFLLPFLKLPFLLLPFLYFLFIPSFTLLSFLFTSKSYFTFKVLCTFLSKSYVLYFPSLTLLSFFYFIFKTSSPFGYNLIWPNPIWFCFFNPSFFSFLVRFICICCCFPFTGLKYLIFYSITISHHGEMFQTNTWQV